MKYYEITVNGETYAVAVKEVDEATAKVAAPSVPAAPVAPVAPASSANGRIIKSPMAGTILKVQVQLGQAVKRGDVLFILEAMKMENEIVAAEDGVMQAVLVSQGQSVQSDQELARY